MKPELFSYSKTKVISKLSVYPMEVEDCLEIFDNSFKIRFIEFAAIRYKRCGLVTHEDFPEIETLQDIANILEKEGDIGIVIFHVNIENICSVLVNDTSTTKLQFSNDQKCNHYLKQLSYNAGGNLLINAVKSNIGQFIHCTPSGAIEKYPDKQHYLHKNV